MHGMGQQSQPLACFSETSAHVMVLGETDNGRLAVSVVDALGDPARHAAP